MLKETIPKILGAATLLFTLSGCTNKLEECLAKAEQTYVQEGAKGQGALAWEHFGCFNTPPAANCDAAIRAKLRRTEEEDRCVKLYK